MAPLVSGDDPGPDPEADDPTQDGTVYTDADVAFPTPPHDDSAELLRRDEQWFVEEVQRRTAQYGAAWGDAIALALSERWVRVEPNLVKAASAALRLAAARYRSTHRLADAEAAEEVANRLDRALARSFR